MIKIINENLKKLYGKNILLIHIVVQFLLFVLYVFIYGSKVIGYIDGLVTLVTFGICYLSFILVAYINRSSLTKKIAFFTLIICIYIIIHEKIYEFFKLEIYFSTFLIFCYLETMMSVFTLDLMKIRLYRAAIATLILLNIILHISNNKYTSFMYGIIWILVSIYPILFIAINSKKVIKYGRKILPSIIVLILLQIVFILSVFFIDIPGRDTNNYDVIFYILILEIIYFTYTLRIYDFNLNFNFLDTKKTLLLIFILSILLFLIVNKTHIMHLIIIFLFSLIFQHEVEVFLYFISYDSKKLFKNNTIKDLIRREEIEQLQREKTSAYLHDEILQDILIIKKDLEDMNLKKENDISIILLGKIINSIRDEINLYDVKIDSGISLDSNYFNLIESIRRKYQEPKILIDFEYDEKFFVPKPFDSIIYRILHELVTNIFKHSNGYYSRITLDVVEEKIKIIVENFGDYLDDEEIYNKSAGLKIIKNEVERYDGTFVIEALNNDEFENEDLESVVQIKVIIPMKGEDRFENFISGRS